MDRRLTEPMTREERRGLEAIRDSMMIMQEMGCCCGGFVTCKMGSIVSPRKKMKCPLEKIPFLSGINPTEKTMGFSLLIEGVSYLRRDTLGL
jgi:hypothetical protein